MLATVTPITVRKPNRRPGACPVASSPEPGTWTRSYQTLLSEASANLHSIGVTPGAVLSLRDLDSQVTRDLAAGIAAAGSSPEPAAYFR